MSQIRSFVSFWFPILFLFIPSLLSLNLCPNLKTLNLQFFRPKKKKNFYSFSLFFFPHLPTLCFSLHFSLLSFPFPPVMMLSTPCLKLPPAASSPSSTSVQLHGCLFRHFFLVAHSGQRMHLISNAVRTFFLDYKSAFCESNLFTQIFRSDFRST